MATKKAKLPVGRPSTYTPKLAAKICRELALGKSLRTVCVPDDMPNISTIFEWMRAHEDFSKQYARAKEESADALNEQILDLGDEAIRTSQEVDFKASNAVVSAYKLKADNLKWYMSKMKPKKYGDKLDVTSDGERLPTPIMSVVPTQKDVQGNNSNTEDQKADEED